MDERLRFCVSVGRSYDKIWLCLILVLSRINKCEFKFFLFRDVQFNLHNGQMSQDILAQHDNRTDIDPGWMDKQKDEKLL